MNFSRISEKDAQVINTLEEKELEIMYNTHMSDDPRIQALKEYLYSRKLFAHTVKDIVWKVKELFM